MWLVLLTTVEHDGAPFMLLVWEALEHTDNAPRCLLLKATQHKPTHALRDKVV